MSADTNSPIHHDDNSLMRSLSRTQSRDSSEDQVTYPALRDNTRILRNIGGLSPNEVDRIYGLLEEKGIHTVDQMGTHVDNEVLEDMGIPSGLIDMFREECRRDELFAEGRQCFSAPRY